MKTKTRTIIFSCLTALFFLTLNRCTEDRDTVKPVIELHEPAEGDVLQIGNEDGMHFEADFSDNEALASYRIEIHPNFDNHSHSRADEGSVDFTYDRSWKISGRNFPAHQHAVLIPENATPGDYHLMVYCLDEEGNTSYVTVNIELSHEAGEGHGH
jgi:hypothetical protein